MLRAFVRVNDSKSQFAVAELWSAMCGGGRGAWGHCIVIDSGDWCRAIHTPYLLRVMPAVLMLMAL